MTQDKIRIGLNGFGRIGRSILRILAADPSEFEVAFINDIESLDTCAYLFKYDSVFGPYAGQVDTGPAALIIDGRAIPFHGSPDISTMDLSDVDVVLECTGMAGKRAVAERGLQAGARKVLISGPSDEADVTIVLGANDDKLAGQKIVSNASCTTNALAPLLKVLADKYDHGALLHWQPADRRQTAGGPGAIPCGGVVDGADDHQRARSGGRGVAASGTPRRGPRDPRPNRQRVGH